MDAQDSAGCRPRRVFFLEHPAMEYLQSIVNDEEVLAPLSRDAMRVGGAK